jgi:membrane protein DedA with SNARE-associated domain
MTDRESSRPRRLNTNLLRRLLIATLAAGLLALIVLAAISELQMEPPGGWRDVRDAIKRFGYLGGFLLIYVEESGIPLFVPGDVFLVYVGHRLPANIWAWLAAWLGFVVAVVLGSTNLYLLSRRLGRRVLAHPVARFLHLTPERLAKAESEFRQWGPWAVILGRHVPGLRVPITVAAGILEMELRIFLASVAISSAVWAAVFLALGIAYGESVARLLHMPVTYTFLPVLLGLLAGWFFRRQLGRLMRRAPSWAVSLWRPQHLAETSWNLIVGLACSASLVGLFTAEFLTETAYLGIGAAIPVVTTAWLLSGRAAVAVTTLGCVLPTALHFVGSLDAVSAGAEIAGLAVVGAMVAIAASLARARNEGRDLKSDLEDHDRRLRSLQKVTLELINTFSHELRTPLGVMRGYVSMLEDGSLTPDRYPAVGLILSRKLEEMNDLIEGSLADYTELAVAEARRSQNSADARASE